MQQTVREYVRATEKLLELKDLSDEEEQVVREVLSRLSTIFPDEGDDAAD